MSIRSRIDDAEFLWNHNRIEGAFLSALVAVASTAKRKYPKQTDRKAFEDFLKQDIFERWSVEYRGELHPMYSIFYKWFRCELAHKGSLPIDIEFTPDSMPFLRAGGAPEYVLKVSYGWFHKLIEVVKQAEINADLFGDST